jgi:hypothetical protein
MYLRTEKKEKNKKRICGHTFLSDSDQHVRNGRNFFKKKKEGGQRLLRMYGMRIFFEK